MAGHSFESLPYVFLALSAFALALMGARRLLGERLGERVALGIGAAAALAVFAPSVFYDGQFNRVGGDAERDKTEMAEFSAIRKITRGKRAAPFQYVHVQERLRLGYYLAGSYVTRSAREGENVCDPRGVDFTVSPTRIERLKALTPDNRFVFLYENSSPLELCRAERRALESSEPAARGEFDVYLQADTLRYLKAPCEPSDYEAPFFIHAHPADPNAEIRFTLRYQRPEIAMAFDGACILTARLPDYPIAALQTGHWAGGGEWLWEVSITPPPDAETLALYENAYQAIASSGAPAARSGFDLYLDGDALSYLKEPCGESDARGRFFLSVHPANVEDLPEDRREIGHESLNFTFAPPVGALFNGKCMAVRPLPDYEIARIETGQWVPGGDELWKAGIVVGD